MYKIQSVKITLSKRLPYDHTTLKTQWNASLNDCVFFSLNKVNVDTTSNVRTRASLNPPEVSNTFEQERKPWEDTTTGLTDQSTRSRQTRRRAGLTKPNRSSDWNQPQTGNWHFSAAAIILHLCEYLIQLRREQFPLFCQGLNSPGSTHARLRQIYAQSQKWYFRQIESTGICVVGHVCAVIKFRTYATLTLESNRNLDVYRVRF